MSEYTIGGILGRLAMRGVILDTPKIDLDTQRFLWACRDPEQGIPAALDHFQRVHGRSFILTFINPEGVELSSHLIENAKDLYNVSLLFGESWRAQSIKLSSNQHTARR